MPILISKTYQTVTPESAEYGDYSDIGFIYEKKEFTFIELVDALSEYSELSSWPVNASNIDFDIWASSNDEIIDYETMETTTYSLHFCRDNKPHNLRYWKLALLSAGLIK